MEYAEFEVEYRRVYEVIINGRGDRDLTADIARLHELVARIDDEDDREDAHFEVLGLEDALSHGDEEPPSEIVQRARQAYAEAVRDDGTIAERLARAEEGMRALERLSPGADPDEKAAIGDYEHTLHMHIGALRLMQ